MKPHKHAELIKAWADGAEIQDRYKFGYGDWTDWADNDEPTWQFDHEYRIKPEPKPDVETTLVLMSGSAGWIEFKDYSSLGDAIEEIQLIRDGETGKLKSAEVLE